MAKFKGPDHVTSITISTGPVTVESGIAEIVGELTQGDVAGLKANGFDLVTEGVYFAVPALDPEPEPEPEPVKASAKASKQPDPTSE